MVIIYQIMENQDASFSCSICGQLVSPLADYHVCNRHLIIIYTSWEKALESGLQEYLDKENINV